MLIMRIVIFSIGLISLVYSSICLLKPDSGIKIFQAWCRYLNWKVEPIKYDFEIRSTRRFGFIGFVLSAALLYKAVFMLQV